MSIHEKPKIFIVPQLKTCFYNLSLFDISQKQYFLFLSFFSFFVISPHDSPSPNIAVICINLYVKYSGFYQQFPIFF